ncbi:S8 family serine peptidase [Aquimarina pacifica]|uniref:S8 family serine peptidase n=1 Tax=Aquimarina pacifica TaxID=1296415 RepID=UPI000472ED8E|nr:S8 family serine peptidase [Aquimarina pacifica]
MRKIVYNILFPLLLFLTISSYGQDQLDSYYYHKGKKVFLTINTQAVSVSFEGESSVSSFSSFKSSETEISEIVEDRTRSIANPIDAEASKRKNRKSFYMEVATKTSLSNKEYREQIASFKLKANTLMVSPTYIKNGHKIGLTNNFYVKLKHQDDVKLLYAKAKEMDVEVLGHDKFMPLWFTLSINKPKDLNALNLANIFYETGLFESTEPAFTYHDLIASDDTFFGNQWALLNTGQNEGTSGIDINAEQAWNLTTGSSDIKTAVFDHGIELDHPDLVNRIHGTGFDANNGTTPATVRGSHGTACAGIVSAEQDNNLGVSGVAPDSELISISINLRFSDTAAQLASGFNWAWQNGADIISNSWGGYTPSSIIDDAIANAITNGRDGKGCVIVFAAGNEDNTNIRYPGNNNPDILVVGAMSPCGERKSPDSCDGESWWGSCFGAELDVVAPGVLIPTTDRQEGSGYSETDYVQDFNGTSSACPAVAGVAALVLSVNPSLTFQQVNDIIEQSAQKVRTDLYTYDTTSGRNNGTWNIEMGYGLVDAYQAVILAQAQVSDCVENLTITQNVPSGDTDIQKAATSVTASNVISNGGAAIYTAGTRVIMTTGFIAQSGSYFQALTEVCTGASAAQESVASNKVNITYETIDPQLLAEYKEEEKTFDAFPIPTNDILTITSKENMVSWQLVNQTGNVVRVSNSKNNAFQRDQVALGALSSGFYMLLVTLDTGEKTYKSLIKN